jgi:predicted solute-binding protein
MDIGELWTNQTGASLPLGLNVVSRSLPQRVRQDISDIFVESCSYALTHREQFVRMAQIPDHTYYSALSGPQLRHYLDLYANQTTVSILERDKQGFEELLRRATAAGHLKLEKSSTTIDWI